MDEPRNGRPRVRPAPFDAGLSDVAPVDPDSGARLRIADTDDAAASEARCRYRRNGVEPLEPDERIRWLLAPGEQVLAVRRCVAFDRPRPSGEASDVGSIRGDLYVTSVRLIHVGRHLHTFDLDDIVDAELAGDRILLLLRDGVGIVLEADRPRLLRVQIATARAARADTARRRRGRAQPASR